MSVPLNNCKVTLRFKTGKTFVNGRERLTFVDREIRGFVTTEWSRVQKSGIVPPKWEGKQRLQFTMKANFVDNAGNPIFVEPDMDVWVTMDNKLIDNKLFKVVEVVAAPTGKIMPAWLIYLGEAAT